LGSLSEATDVFDPERLKEIISELGDQRKPLEQDKKTHRHQTNVYSGLWLTALGAAKHDGSFMAESQ
jgi:hypothetical protein